jgi:RNA polymerase sigma-70 factor (ECF subfamily)
MSGSPALDARRSAERAARDSYGRLVAILAARTRDVAAAEDALAEAFRQALESWPGTGVPERPEAWLLVAARRTLGHQHRHLKVREGAAATLALLTPAESAEPAAAIPDERLRLLFACAHPDVDPAAQAPLMLQAVLGLDAERIASCFLVAPTTMGQRLVRAKARIKAAGIPFEIPEPVEMAGRLAAVLDAIYATYGTGWEDVLGEDPRRKGLAEEAIWLARLLCALLPEAPEPKGLLALMLHCEARRSARRDEAGRFVPLADQDRTLWDAALIAEAEELLHRASRSATLGRYQIEAAIQSLHVHRAFSGNANWDALRTLYDWLARVSPTIGVLVARAAVLAEAGDADSALSEIEALGPAGRSYQPSWAVRALALRRLGRTAEAAECYRMAAGLTEDLAVREHLLAEAARAEA